MGSQYLLDTNAVIDFAANRLPLSSAQKLSEIVDDAPVISFINKIELIAFTNVPIVVNSFVDAAKVITINDEIINQTIEVRKRYRLKLPDAIIAATAIVNNLTLVTHNIKDFRKINGLNLIDSYQL